MLEQFDAFSASVEIQDAALALGQSTFWGLHAGNINLTNPEKPGLRRARREKAFCCFELAPLSKKSPTGGLRREAQRRGDVIRWGNQNTVCAGHC